MRNRTFIARTLLSALAVCSPFAAFSAESFQDLPWGVSEAHLQEKFAGALKAGECTGQEQMLADASGSACGGLVLDSYIVEGTPFRVKFNLAKDSRTLKDVYLFARFEPSARERTRVEARLQHDRITALLVGRYGAPIDKNVSADPEGQGAVKHSITTWLTKTSRITLATYAFTEGGKPAAMTQNLIFRPVPLTQDSGKL